MKTILLFGAGKSATSLIEYLATEATAQEWQLLVCDTNLELAQMKTRGLENARAKEANVSDDATREQLISEADLVISMLPPSLHYLVAEDCVRLSRNLLTASYLDQKVKELEAEIEDKGLLFISEMGLDPGIDHMSAMKLIHTIQNRGHKISSFKSHCGGLVSPESDNNPWHYKITWNPANVVTAGSAGADFLRDGEQVHIPYGEIFRDQTDQVFVPTLEPLAWYANRDSLSYIDTYQLDGIDTFLRTTLRYPAFSRGWQRVVELGLTVKNDAEEIEICKTFADWFDMKNGKFYARFPEMEQNTPEFIEQAKFLGLVSEDPIPETLKNSAAILQFLLETKLVMQPDDKDMVVMLHEMEFEDAGKMKKISSSLIVTGQDQLHTAMAKTVGLPLGIAAKLILRQKINLTGLHIPVIPEIYLPVLEELAQNGISFVESEVDL